MKQAIIKRIEKTLEEAGEDFSRNPSRFFTESDIKCFIVRKLEDELKEYAVGVRKDKISLVHTEYPTLTKCQMKGKEFKETDDDSKSRRGHFDIVVLNSEVINKVKNIEVIRGQSFNEEFIQNRDQYKPWLLYAIELMRIKRNPKSRKKSDKDKRYKSIVQDFNKLEAAYKKRFLKNGIVLVLEIVDINNDTRNNIISKLKGELQDSTGVKCKYIPWKRDAISIR